MANYTSVIASNICDASGNKLAAGTVSFQATDAANQPLNFQVGGGGQVVTTPATAAITAGAIAGGFQVADSANTSPAGILYRITVTDTTLNRVVVTYSLVTVTGATFNLDNYAPTGASVLPPTGGSVVGPLTVTGNLSVTGSFNPGTLGNVTSTGTVLAKNIESVRYADQFAGTDIGAKINAAYADLPTKTVTDVYFSSITAPYGTIIVPAGDYSFSTPIVINSPFVNIVGQGMTATALKYTGSGTAVWLNPNSNMNEFVSGNGLFDISIDGAGAGAGAIGLRTTDFSGFRANNVCIRNFSGAGSVGWLDDAIHWYNEKMCVTRMALMNNTASWKINPQATAPGYPNTTFGYGLFDVSILNHSGQTGLLLTNGNFSFATIKLTVNQVDTPANATAIQLQNSAQFGPNNYMIEIESPGGIGTGHEINISSTQALPFTGVGSFVQGAMTSNITGVTENGNTQYLPPQDGLWWPILKTPGSTTGFNPAFRIDPNAPNQTRLNVIDVEATAPASYQRNQWPTASGQIANKDASQTWTANQTFALNTPTLFINDTTPAQSTPNKAIAVANGELHVANSALSVNILKLTDTGNLTVTGSFACGGGTALARYARYTPTLSPVAVAANTTAEQSFASVLTSGDVVVGISKPTAQAGLGIVGWRASGTTLFITFSNNTAGSITPTASEVYQVVAVQ